MWFFVSNNITLSITGDTKRRMKEHPGVRWSSVVRAIIDRKLKDFEEAEKLAQKSKLTEKDVEMLSQRVAKDFAKHSKRLLDESNS